MDRKKIENILGIEAQDAPRISAKSGLNIEDVLEQVVHKVPAPIGDEGVDGELKSTVSASIEKFCTQMDEFRIAEAAEKSDKCQNLQSIRPL